MTATIAEISGLKQPKPWALKGAPTTGCSDPARMMGVELEIEHCDEDDETYSSRLSKLGWAVTTDGSLRGRNVGRAPGVQSEDGFAYEFISRPMAQHTILHSLEEFFKITKFNEDNYTDRTSVHVHVNCLDLTFAQLSSVALAYTVIEEILFKFVGQERENNIYCIPWTHCRMNYDIVDRIEADGIGVIKRWQKYTALNLLPLLQHGTVEFRHMHGTADMARLRTWINLIGSVFKFSTTTLLTELITEIKTLNSSSEYEVFFHKVLGDYLPYNDEYRASLEAGVIAAKYSLINWKKEKKATADKKTRYEDEPLRYGIEEMLETMPGSIPPPQAIPRTAVFRPRPVVMPVQAPAAPNRFDPWPLNGFAVDLPTGLFNSLTATEQTTMRRPALAGCWEIRNGLLTVIGQPPARWSVDTVRRRQNDAMAAAAAFQRPEPGNQAAAQRLRALGDAFERNGWPEVREQALVRNEEEGEI